MALKITKIIWGIICLFFVWLWSDDFCTAFRTPEIYPFGEGGPINLWWFETQKSYLIFGIVLIIWFFIGLILCLFQYKVGKLKYGIAVHIIVTIIYIIVIRILLL
jgi:hypothetical protein